MARLLVFALAAGLCAGLCSCGGGGGASASSSGGSGSTDTPAGGSSPSVPPVVTVTPPWPQPVTSSYGLMIDAASQLATPAQLDAFGGALFDAWNPLASAAAGPGMKILMFGQPNGACPAGTQGPMGSFADAALAGAGYPGSASAVPAAMRFEPVPMSACSSAAAGLSGPGLVFGDGAQLWFSTASLGGSTDLLLPYGSGGVNGSGANAENISTAVNYVLYSASAIAPWAQNGRARLAASAQVNSLEALANANVVQTKQLMGVTLLNTACLASQSGSLCQMYWQFAQAIVQNNVGDWSTVTALQDANVMLDPAKSDMPTINVPLLAAAGATGVELTSGLPFYISHGVPTQHAAFGLAQFDVEIDLVHLENALRVASALTLGQTIGTDSACTQCQQVFGASWNDPNAWVIYAINTSQEIHDPSGNSAQILGGYAWIYGGAAP